MHVEIEIDGHPYSHCGGCGSYVDPQIHLCPAQAVEVGWDKFREEYDFSGPVS